ncbi:DNA-directed RNA polymerase III subunit RPC8 [Nematocida sp. LUAm3]|nr:DNA-directed RNA polymerase III subunit RPC8 [Nematocida sp. LUAm3]KAI5176247.1 DNA-directed RNA polymerase III subunit RPC8 [Nematocida sp. LUAm2]KAI5176705.1 DNA-directed RNA polymerase III subunit RPC8 [Nematocida sp. LUAm1]
MFVETVQRQRLSISPCAKDIKEEVRKLLLRKIPGKILPGEGVLLFPTELKSLDDVQVHDGMLYPMVEYKVVMYKAHAEEILYCTVEKHSEEGIHMNHPLLSGIFVPSAQLPIPSSFETLVGRNGQRIKIWAWKYNETLLYIKQGEKCRVRVIQRQPDGQILCSLKTPGLGPLVWW